MCSIKTVYQKKVHKYTFLGLKLCFMLTINGLWGCEVGVLCRGSTSEVHSAGKHIVSVSAMQPCTRSFIIIPLLPNQKL